MNDESPVERSVGRYQVLEELGRGAMGIVYRGFDPVIRRTVALKTMAFSPQDAESRTLRERLYREAAAAGTLTHPNIVTIYDIIDDGATTAVAMEFVEGQTLADLLAARRAVPINEALAIFEPICAALDYAGSKGIVHRDIKPANIMLTPDGRPKIMDFGIARLAIQGQTQTATIMGTPSYMSPEQVRGLALDPRSDLFSAAVVFFEMIAGERPFGGDDVATTMYRIVNEPPRAVDQLISTVSPAVGGVIEWALSKNPAERYQTGGELVGAIRQALSSGTVARSPFVEPTVVVDTTSVYSPTVVVDSTNVYSPVETPSPRRSPLVLYGVIGTAVLVLVVVLAIVFGGGLGQTTTSQAQNSGGASSSDAGAGAAPGSPVAAEPRADPTGSSRTPTPEDRASRATKDSGRVASTTTAARTAQADRRGVDAKMAAEPPAALPATTTAQAATPTAPPSPAASPTTRGALPPTPGAAPPPAAPPPPAETAVAAAVASAVFAVKGEDYSGVRILVDDRLLPGPYPAQIGKLAAGAHRVVYRWVSGASAGRELADSITVSAGGHFIIRASLDSEKLVVQQLR